MKTIKELDLLVSEIAGELHRSVETARWKAATMFCKYTADASVSGHDFDYTLEDGSIDRGSAPADEALLRLSKITKAHWQLTQDLAQARWYKMIVTVERSGKFSVDFEYKDDYQEGDIMKRS